MHLLDCGAWVEAARQKQIERFADRDVPFNAAIPAGRVLEFCDMTPMAKDLFKETIDKQSLSTRSMDRLAKSHGRSPTSPEPSKLSRRIFQKHVASSWVEC